MSQDSEGELSSGHLFEQRPRSVNSFTRIILKRASAQKPPAYLPARYSCPDCKEVQRRPVTAECGHTRCWNCINTSRTPCVCGTPAPQVTHTDVLVQTLIERWFPGRLAVAEEADRAIELFYTDNFIEARELCEATLLKDPQNARLLELRTRLSIKFGRKHEAIVNGAHLVEIHPRWPEAHLANAEAQMLMGQFGDAVVSFALCVALGRPVLAVPQIFDAVELWLNTRPWETLVMRNQYRAAYYLPETIMLHRVLSKLTRWRRTWSQYMVLIEICPNILDPDDLECVLCSRVFVYPVTTPCGHTFCRECITRCYDYNLPCPLCTSNLEAFEAENAKESSFVSGFVHGLSPELRGIPVDPHSDMLPIFVCTVGFPSVPCPLLVFEPRYRLMIRRCLASENKQFGIAPISADERDKYAEYGTILEIKDCVKLPNGDCIVSTVGVGRFQVVDRDQVDGYDLAKVKQVNDKERETNLEWLIARVRQNVIRWFNEDITIESRQMIESSFGPMPEEDVEMHGHGPNWLWWVYAVLPIASHLKVVAISSTSLQKRLLAAERVLDLLDTGSPPLPFNCSEDTTCPLVINDGSWISVNETRPRHEAFL